MNKLSRTEYIKRVNNHFELVDYHRDYGMILYNKPFIITLEGIDNELKFINNKINLLIGNDYNLNQKDLLIEKNNLFINSNKNIRSLNLMGLYETLLNKGIVILSEEDNNNCSIYRVEDSSGLGPYSKKSIRVIDNTAFNQSPSEDYNLCSLFRTSIKKSSETEPEPLMKDYIFGFKDMGTLKKWFVDNEDLHNELLKHDFNIVEINIHKNETIKGRCQSAFNSKKIIDKKVLFKYQDYPLILKNKTKTNCFILKNK
jgi:hypothetical protein